jgi:alpha-beta hydrolase superfamily lysophospholipase
LAAAGVVGVMLSYSALSSTLATERGLTARKGARTAWERRQRGELRIRAAVEADMRAVVRLARLDSSRPPVGTILVGEDAGEIVAALSVEDGAVVADPFRATAPVVTMLRLRAEQLSEGRDRGRPRRRFSLRRRHLGAASA